MVCEMDYEKITCAAAYRGIRSEMIGRVIHESIGTGMPMLSESLSSFHNKAMYRFWAETILMIYEEWIAEGKPHLLKMSSTLRKVLS